MFKPKACKSDTLPTAPGQILIICEHTSLSPGSTLGVYRLEATETDI